MRLEPAASVEALLLRCGLDGVDLLALEQVDPTDDCAVYISGSLAEGLGNPQSDLDVFVVGPRTASGPHILTKRDFTISLHNVRGRRIDFEHWPDHVVERIRTRLDSLRLGHEFVAERLDHVEELFVHRVWVGVPLVQTARWHTLRETFDLDLFRGYLVQQAVHRIDGALDDLDGMLAAGDVEAAAYRARDVLGHAVDVHRHSCGDTNPLPKWRAMLLERLPSNDRTTHVRMTYRELSFASLDVIDAGAVERYVTSCAGLAHEVVRWAQS